MTSSTETARGTVLKGVDASTLRPARLSADLRSSPFAGTRGFDPRLVDPSLEGVVAEAAAAAAEQARTAGWAAGYGSGQLAGQQAAQDAAVLAERLRAEQTHADHQYRHTQLALALQTLADAAEALDRRQAPARDEVERIASALAVEIAAALVGHHLEVGECGGDDAVTRVLRLAGDEPVTVHLHPDDAAVLSPALAGRLAAVVADPSIELGGCVADCGPRRIDAQIGPALDRMREVLAS
jgi:flagellar assembly protein FliH